MEEKFATVFSPFTVKNLVLKNRLVMPPMGSWFATSFGAVTPQLISYHRERAAGGVGLNVVEFTVVESKGKLSPHMLGIYDDAHIPGLKSLVGAVHEAGGKIAVQLGHAGRRARSSINGGRRPWAPRAVQFLLVPALLATALFFMGELRFRIPFDVVLLPLAVLGWTSALTRLAGPGRRTLVVAALGLVWLLALGIPVLARLWA